MDAVIPSMTAAGINVIPTPGVNLLGVIVIVAGLLLVAALLPGSNYD